MQSTVRVVTPGVVLLIIYSWFYVVSGLRHAAKRGKEERRGHCIGKRLGEERVG